MNGKRQVARRGDGGHAMKGRNGADADAFHLDIKRFSGAGTGELGGHARRMGKRGRVSKIRLREAMRESGMSGRLMKACHGQFEGSSVRSSWNLGR